MKFATSNYSSASIPAYLLNGTIPFDTLDYAAVIPFYLIFLAGLLISLTICVSLFNRIRTARSKILNQDIWVLALSLNELIFSSQILAFLSYNISNGGFSLSSAECIANGILTISCSGFSVQIILLMTIDRYT